MPAKANPNKTNFNIKMDKDLKQWLDETAQKLHMTTTALTVMMLSQSMDTTKQLIKAHEQIQGMNQNNKPEEKK